MITPKYSHGQVVWGSSFEETTERLPCPDCAGTGKWTVTTANDVLEVACGRCRNYNPYDLPENTPALVKKMWRVSARALTIGKITVTDPPSDYDRDAVTYMCVETGIGSGSVYGESLLFATEDEALAHATTRAQLEQQKWEATPSVQTHRALTRLNLRTAFAGCVTHAGWHTMYHFKILRREIIDLIDSEENCSEFGVDQKLRDKLRELADPETTFLGTNYHLDPEHNPFMALLQAAERACEDDLSPLIAALEPFRFLLEQPVRPTPQGEGII